MTQIPLDIDRVVREVLAELKRAPTSSATAASGANASLSISVENKAGATAGLSSSAENTVKQAGHQPKVDHGTPTSSSTSELVLSTRLVTMDDIEDRLYGIRRVVVGPHAVVTPAVRDALQQRNITLSRALPTKNTTGASLRLVVVAAQTKLDPKLVASTLQGGGIDVECHRTDCIIVATDRLAGELSKNDTLGLLLTPHTAAALCLANRLAGVRAVMGNNTGRLAADLVSVGANLLVVDPQSVGLSKLCQMAAEYCRGGIRPCPEVFRKRLM
jgi:hypothetical protein